jgi:hypothetical protein
MSARSRETSTPGGTTVLQIDATQQEWASCCGPAKQNLLQNLLLASLLSKRFSLLGKFPDPEGDNQ